LLLLLCIAFSVSPAAVVSDDVDAVAVMVVGDVIVTVVDVSFADFGVRVVVDDVLLFVLTLLLLMLFFGVAKIMGRLSSSALKLDRSFEHFLI